jgi:RNA polymerase sigma-70 factor (ECF subfamily)
MASDPAPPDGAPPAALSPDELARRFQEAAGLLWTVASGVLGDRSGVEDVLQETCLIALEKRHQYERGTRLASWLARIAHLTALNHARRHRRGGEAAVPSEQPATGPADPSSCDPDLGPRGELLLDQRHFDDAVQAALLELEPTRRACLLLRVLRELDYREISELLGIPEGTAMSHVHRARATLRMRLEGLGAEGGAEPARARGGGAR